MKEHTNTPSLAKTGLKVQTVKKTTAIFEDLHLVTLKTVTRTFCTEPHPKTINQSPTPTPTHYDSKKFHGSVPTQKVKVQTLNAVILKEEIRSYAQHTGSDKDNLWTVFAA